MVQRGPPDDAGLPDHAGPPDEVLAMLPAHATPFRARFKQGEAIVEADCREWRGYDNGRVELHHEDGRVVTVRPDELEEVTETDGDA